MKSIDGSSIPGSELYSAEPGPVIQGKLAPQSSAESTELPQGKPGSEPETRQLQQDIVPPELAH